MRTAAKPSTTPSTISNAAVGSVSQPPTAAAGTLAAASGRNSRRSKWPARANCTLPIVATTTFNTSAVGLITSGSRPKSVITAM